MRFRSWIVLLALTACGNAQPPSDAANVDARDASAESASDVGDANDARLVCTTDVDCSDSIFCNGAERCMPGAAGADARGCIAAPEPACLASQRCVEAVSRCESNCAVARDADGDGHVALACGGDDCDDSDAQRFPGNAEVCDPSHDEDCNPLSVGDSDGDGDGYLDHACCNRVPGTNAVCGLDCDDAQPNVHPDQAEVCNGVDDNCNGFTDENVSRFLYPDTDGDGYGSRVATPIAGCMLVAGQSENALDCDDTNALVSPVAVETCNGADDNCNGQVDDAAATAQACSASYGMPAHTTFACTGGACQVTCPMPYANCDARLDNGCESDTQSDVNNCGACGVACGVGGTCTAGVCDHITQVTAGADFTCALRSNGNVVCWGNNALGQLGDGTGRPQARPSLVRNLGNATWLAGSHIGLIQMPYQACPAVCAMHGAAVVCWGCNTLGQIGNGMMNGIVTSLTTDVVGLPTIDFRYGTGTMNPPVTVGGSHACVNQLGPGPGGGGVCWGSNQNGQMNRGGGGTQLTPVGVGATTTSWMSGGAGHMCVVNGGALVCWGYNAQGQCGAPMTPGSVTYTNVALAAGVPQFGFVQVEAGMSSTCARGNTGQVYCWGLNDVGQLGDGSSTAGHYDARPVPGIADAMKLANGANHACVVRRNGQVACWGANTYGQIGDGTTTNAATPRTVAGINDAIDVSTSMTTTCVVRSSGRVSCWGRNDFQQLGDETTTNRSTPVTVHGL